MNKKNRGQRDIRFRMEDEFYQKLVEDHNWENQPIETLFTCMDLVHEIDKSLGLEGDVSSSQFHSTSQRRHKTKSMNDTVILNNLKAYVDRSCSVDLSRLKFVVHEKHSLGYGVVATSDVVAGEVLMQIKRDSMISARFPPGRISALGNILAQLVDNPVLELIACLLYHKLNEDQSPFSAYLTSLPKQYYELPWYWPKEIFQCLASSTTMIRCIRSVRTSMVLFYRLITALNNANSANLPRDKISWSLFLWALSTVATRQNNIELRKITNDPNLPQNMTAITLVPGWDLMNHERGEMTTTFDEKEDCLIFRAMKDIKEGEEVTMCYGFRSNELLLLYSGFAVPNNPDDSYDFDLPLTNDELLKIRILIISNSGIKVGSDSICSVSIKREENCALSKQAFVVLAALLSNKEEALHLMKSLPTCSTTEDIFQSSGIPNSIKKKVIEYADNLAKNSLEGITLAISQLEKLEFVRLTEGSWHSESEVHIKDSNSYDALPSENPATNSPFTLACYYCYITLQGHEHILTTFRRELEILRLAYAAEPAS